MPEELTTVQIDVETRDKLREIASANFRSMAGHLKFLIAKEYDEWQESQILSIQADTSILRG